MKTWILGTEYDTTNAKEMSSLMDKIALALVGALGSVKEVTEVKGSDSVCPVCGGDEIEGGHMEVDTNEAFQACTCSCGASWNNTYSFVGSSEIKEG